MKLKMIELFAPKTTLLRLEFGLFKRRRIDFRRICYALTVKKEWFSLFRVPFLVLFERILCFFLGNRRQFPKR